jgi:hypothetical protein
MYYGHKPHVPSPDDLTLLHCFCGWTSEELTRQQLSDRGIPWYCDNCGKSGLQFIHFHPRERHAAYLAFDVTERLRGERPSYDDGWQCQEDLDRIG